MIPYEAVIIIAGWLVSLAVALKVVPKLAAKRVSEQFGLTQVTQNGQTFYAPVDPSGEPVKIPLGTKEGKDGGVEVIMGYAPLAYCLPYMAADMAAQRIKMTLLGAKGRVSKQLRDSALAEGMAVGEGASTLDMLGAAGILPKKWYGIAKVLQGLNLSPGSGPTTNERPSGGSKTRVEGGWRV
jgi:hypothetical protein